MKDGDESEPEKGDLPDEGDLPEEGDLPHEGDLPDEGDLPEEGDLPDEEEGGPQIVVDEVDLREALRGALQPPPGSVAPNLLRGVQRKLRVRSRGKFYGDGWSTAESPRTTYLITSALMLLLVLIVFLTLVPWSSTTVP